MLDEQSGSATGRSDEATERRGVNPFSRRGFLRVAGLGSITTAAGAFLAACTNSSPTPPSSSTTSSGGSTSNPGTAQNPAVRVTKDSRLGQIVSRGKLTVATTSGDKPAAFRDTSGNLTGYFVEVAQRMADDLGVKLDMVDQEWAGHIPGIIAGKIDMVSDALTNTPRRARSIFFSNPYFPSLNVLMVLKSKKRASYDAYNQPNVTLTATQGTTQSQVLQFLFPKAKYNGLPDPNAVGLEVASGRADGAVLDASQVAALIKANGSLDYFDINHPLGYEYGAFAIQYGDWEFRGWIDEWMRYWHARSYFQTTYNKWYQEVLGTDLLSAFQIPRY